MCVQKSGLLFLFLLHNTFALDMSLVVLQLSVSRSRHFLVWGIKGMCEGKPHQIRNPQIVTHSFSIAKFSNPNLRPLHLFARNWQMFGGLCSDCQSKFDFYPIQI